jgi:hypothetical protein
MADWILPDLRDILGPTLGLTLELPQPGVGGLPIGSRVAPTSDGFLIWMNPCKPQPRHPPFVFYSASYACELPFGFHCIQVRVPTRFCKPVGQLPIVFQCPANHVGHDIVGIRKVQQNSSETYQC